MGIEQYWAGYSFGFKKQENPEAYRLGESLAEEGVSPQAVDGGGSVIVNSDTPPPDHVLDPKEIFDYVSGQLRGGTPESKQRVLGALTKANVPVAGRMWAIEQDGFPASMAAYYNTQAAQLYQASGEKDWGKIEKDLIAVTHFEPDNAEHRRNLGGFYVSRQDYPKAREAFQAALDAYGRDRYGNRDFALAETQVSLGGASFGMGDFKAARETYTEVLKENPRDVEVLRLRAEADACYLKTVTDPAEQEEIQTEIRSDRAMVLARTKDDEKARLVQIEKALSEKHSLSLDEKRELTAVVEGMARDYLALGGQGFESPSDAEFVRSSLNGLSADAFGILKRFAADDKDPAIKKTSALYEGYEFLAQGKMGEAKKTFEKIRDQEDPMQPGRVEASTILDTMEHDTLRSTNLAAVDVWKVYTEEGSRIYHEKADSTGSQVLGFITGDFDGLGAHHGIADAARCEKALIQVVQDKLESEEALTIQEALQQVAGNSDQPKELRERAKSILDTDMGGGAHCEGDVLGPMIDYVSKNPPDSQTGDILLRQAFTMEGREGAADTPFAVYQLVSVLSPDQEVRDRAKKEMDAIQNGGGFGRSFLKVVYGTSTTDVLVDAAIMMGSAGLGNLAKLRVLGMGGEGAIAAARVTKYFVTGTALFIGNTGKEAWKGDPAKVFTAEHLLKSYGATLIMVGGTEWLGELGAAFGRKGARALGLVSNGGRELSGWGKAFVGVTGHGAGLGGMITSSYVTPRAMNLVGRLFGWKQDRVMSFGESAAHDVYNYVLFAGANRVTEMAVGSRYSSWTQQVHSEIALREAHSKSKPLAERWLKATMGEDYAKMPKDQKRGLLDRRTEYLAAASFRPGFSGKVLVKALERGEFGKANDYLDRFGLSPIFSPHETMGIKAPETVDSSLKAADRLGGDGNEHVYQWIEQLLVEGGNWAQGSATSTAELRTELRAGLGRMLGERGVESLADLAPAVRDSVVQVFQQWALERCRETTRGKTAADSIEPPDKIGGARRVGEVELDVIDGELHVRVVEGSNEVSVNGTSHRPGVWAFVGEGDTVLINGKHYARIMGELRPVAVPSDDIPVLAHGENGVIMDNGDGTLTKVGGSVQRNAQLDVEQQALGILQYEGLDIAPPLIGRINANELIIGRLEGRTVAQMSVTERRTISQDAWQELEAGLRCLQEMGIQHNDISAGNIIWDGQRLRLIDFGLARLGVRSNDDITRLGKLREAISNGAEGQALYPLPNRADIRSSRKAAFPEIPYAVPAREAPVW